jgi:hypothetical protein
LPDPRNAVLLIEFEALILGTLRGR